MPRLGKFRGSELWFWEPQLSAARIGGSEKGMQDINTTDWLCENRSFFFEKKKGGGKDNKRLLFDSAISGRFFLSFSPEKGLVKFVDKK